MDRRMNISIALLFIGIISYEAGEKIGIMRHNTTPYFWGIGIGIVCIVVAFWLFFGSRK